MTDTKQFKDQKNNKKPVNNVRTGSVAIRIKAADNTVAFGRHFDEKDILVSKVITFIYCLDIKKFYRCIKGIL